MCLSSLRSMLAWFKQPFSKRNKRARVTEYAESNGWDARLQSVPEVPGVRELLNEFYGFNVEVDDGQFTPIIGNSTDVQNAAELQNAQDVESAQDVQNAANLENELVVGNNWHVDGGDFVQAAVVVIIIQDGEEDEGEQQLMAGGLQTIEEETEEELAAFEHDEQ